MPQLAVALNLLLALVQLYRLIIRSWLLFIYH